MKLVLAIAVCLAVAFVVGVMDHNPGHGALAGVLVLPALVLVREVYKLICWIGRVLWDALDEAFDEELQ